MKIKKIFIGVIGVFFVYLIIPYFIPIHILHIPQSTIVYDEHNNEIGEIISQEKYRHREVAIKNIPDFLKISLISIEDRRFYWHSGVDYIGIIRAFKNNFIGGNTQGASTIESQIIRNNYWLNTQRNFSLKIKEFLFALALSKKYSKDELLEMYINNVNFGYLNYGFESASIFYYNKSLKNLTHAEIIGLITIMKNPNIYNPIDHLSNFNKRFILLVDYLQEKKIIGEDEKNGILNEKLSFSQGKKNQLPYVIDFLKNNLKLLSGPIISTTIDYHLTNKIDKEAKESIKTLAWKNVSDYSIILIDRENMNLKVMIGGYDYFSKEGQVNGSLALRQPGSALKPLLYALAFQNLKKTPSSTILDLPVSYTTSIGNMYEPKNYSLDYAGEVSIAEALSQSINIPAVKLLNEIGINSFMKFLKNNGINSLSKDADYYGLSLALGSGEVSLYELTRSYGLFAKGGNFCEIHFIQGQKGECKNIMDTKYTSMVEEILTNRYFKLAGFPINSNLDFADRNVFVKTGTSRNFKDNWSIGYTDKYIIGVWVGNKDGSEMLGVSGASGAGDIFRKIVYIVDNNDVQIKIPSLQKETQEYIKIISPLNKNSFKIDPFTPLENQKIELRFSSNIDYDQIVWYVNNTKFMGNFLSISSLTKKTSLKIEAYKSNILLGSDEISITKN